MKYKLLILILATAICLLVSEWAMRRLGVQPWQRPGDLGIVIEPDIRFFIPHPQYGFTHNPGKFTVFYPGGFTFMVTHDKVGKRITALHQRESETTRPEIWIFGCSYTYGWALNDSETFPWILQEQLPEFRIVNFGVAAFGTIHSYLQCKEAFANRSKPVLIVVAYSSIHDVRNVCSRLHQKNLHVLKQLIPWVQPYARLSRKGKLTFHYEDISYNPIWGMQSLATVHALELIIISLQQSLLHPYEVAQGLLVAFSELAETAAVDFMVIGLDPASQRLMHEVKKTGINTGYIGLDISKKEFNNLPNDIHPNASANKIYADEILRYIKEQLSIK